LSRSASLPSIPAHCALSAAILPPRGAHRSPRVHAGEHHLHPTSPRVPRTETPAFTRGSITFTLRPSARRARKPPRSRGGASPSPYVPPRAAHGSPRVHAGERHLHPRSPRAPRTEAPAFTRGSVTFTLGLPARREVRPGRSGPGSASHRSWPWLADENLPRRAIVTHNRAPHINSHPPMQLPLPPYSCRIRPGADRRTYRRVGTPQM
jgi:hypothetical protein